MQENKTWLKKLEETIGYKFKDRNLLELAMTHCSLSADREATYERMEFLGDAVVGLVIAEHLYNSQNNYSEGEMTDIKSNVVSRTSLMYAGRRLNLDEFLQVDSGLANSSSLTGSLTSDAYEAIAGAVFLDSDFETARSFVVATLEKELVNAEEKSCFTGSKSKLQERLQAAGRDEPAYRIVEISGPAHNRRFKAEVYSNGVMAGEGWGRTKKDAEKKAAKEALEKLFPNS